MITENTRQIENLIEIRSQGIKALKELSQKLDDRTSTLNCNGVNELRPEELQALFSCIRTEWLRSQEFSNFINLDTWEGSSNLSRDFIDYANKESDRRNSSWLEKNKPVLFIFTLIAIAIGGVTALTFLLQKQSALIPQFVTTNPNIPTLETNNLTVGILGSSERYFELKMYLDKTFGNRVQIQFDGSSKTDYQTLKDNIARQKLDVVFTLSPMISIAAKDNGYTWAAKMFADKPPFYQSVLFVKADSPIQSLKDLKPKTVIALGDFNSASSFYMPSYTLYGKKLIVDRGNRGSKIKELVKSGKADVGAAALEVIDGNSKFRIIDKSRDIPGGGVYLSPKLSIQDRQILKKVLLNAPQSAIASEKANYGAGEEPDYTQFRNITNRVESILTCVDWGQKSITFYCPQKEKGIAGKVMSALPSAINSNQVYIEVKTSDRKTYAVIIPLPLINQIPGGGSLLNIKNKQIRLINVQPSKGSDGKLKINIDRVAQIDILK